jgi:4-hydroxy-tetrahydrodipicolinate reductase
MSVREQVSVIQYGLGPIGSAMARHVLEREELSLVGAVDVDTGKVGRDIGEVIALGRPLGIPVCEKLDQALEQAAAQVVLHTTSSHWSQFLPQIREILEAGLDVVSTSEELSFPWLAHKAEAAEIDALARQVGKTVLGTGINPGFLMDSLPLTLTAICQRVDHVEVRRVIDASARRGPFQRKIGSGMSVSQFHEEMAAGRMGHVGLVESTGMLFHQLGRELARFESEVSPIVAEEWMETEHVRVERGQVMGLQQVARGYTDQEELVRLVFIAALQTADPGDTIMIRGHPNLTANLQGTNGDIATVAIAVNAIRRVRDASPGLMTMCDLPIVTR